MSSSPQVPQRPAGSEVSAPAQTIALNYPQIPVDGEARPPLAWGWLIAAVGIVGMSLYWAARERYAPGVLRVGILLLAAELAGVCALAAVRIIWVRWWAAVVILLLLACSVFEVAHLTIGARRSYLSTSSQTVISPTIANIYPLIIGLLGFAWVIGLPVVANRGGTGFSQKRGRGWIIAGVVIGWLAISGSNALVCVGEAIFVGTVTANSPSPDGQTLAIARSEGFMDSSYSLYLQRNSIFALTARHIGGSGAAGSRVKLLWTDDSQVVSLWINDTLSFAYDAKARKPLPTAQASLYLDSNGKRVADPVAYALSLDPAHAYATLRGAAGAGDLRVMKALLDRGLNPDPPKGSKDFPTPLAAAIESGKLEAIQLLLARGASPNGISWEETPLYRAASLGRADIVTMLLDHGADPNLVSSDLGTRLQTPLMAAANRAGVEVVRILLDHGADPTPVNSDGQTALAIAQRYRRNIVVPLLSSATTKPAAKPGAKPTTAKARR